MKKQLRMMAVLSFVATIVASVVMTTTLTGCSCEDPEKSPPCD